MQIVIDIPEQIYLNAKTDMLCGTDVIVNAIKNGTPLPKHGRLIDADAVSLDDIGFFSIGDYQKMVHKLTTSERTIIEADKEQ